MRTSRAELDGAVRRLAWALDGHGITGVTHDHYRYGTPPHRIVRDGHRLFGADTPRELVQQLDAVCATLDLIAGAR